MKFNICVAVPIKSNDSKQNESLIKSVLKENPDFIEVRFDYIDDIRNITSDYVKKLLNLIPSNIPAIFTFRAISEGGQLETSDEERLKILKTLITARPAYLDIEMNSDKFILEEIIGSAVQSNVNLIFSFHNFKETPSYEHGFNFIEAFINNLINKLFIDSKIVKQSIYKMIYTAQDFEDNLTSLKICKTFSKKGHKIICFCMGDLGIFSRLLCVKVGSFLTYASQDGKTAPGQITINKMRNFYELLFNAP